jgi:hypothetical protein
MGMRAGRLRLLAGQGIVAIGVAALAGACSSASSTATVTPSPVPVLGKLTIAAFASTPDGEQALALCDQWALLRGQYISHVEADTPYQLDLWFSGPEWTTALSAQNAIDADPLYSHLSADFGIVMVPDVASIANARLVDEACAAGD